jgi:FYVE/RhoGEF/PH domain-containing protein 5/6
MSGWLQRRSRRSWKRLWFVLKEQVLYVYKASEDVVALEGIPVLGYAVETMKEV